MKKYLMTTVAAVAFSTVAQADFGGKGFYAGLTAGYSNVSSKVKEIAQLKAGPLGEANNNRGKIESLNKKNGGFNGSLLVGHGATFGKGYFAGETFITYDTSKSKAGIYKVDRANHGNVLAKYEVKENTPYAINYYPRLGLGLAAKGGFYFAPTLLGYARLGLEYNFGRIVIDVPKEKIKQKMSVWSLTPGVGVEGQINEKTSWIAGVDYKIAFNSTKRDDLSFQNKPNAFIGKVGLSYHF